MNVTQEDIRAAGDLGERLCSLCEYSRMGEITEAFAIHRQAALLEGVRIGLAAAVVELSIQSCCCSFDMMALDPATVLARHGGA